MKTTHVLRLFLRHWLVIGLVTLAVGAGAFAVSATRTPQYTATSSVYLTIASGPSAANLAQGSNYLQDQMDSFGELATSSRVLNTVIDELNLNTTAKDLAKHVTAVVPRNTVILQLSAADADPRTAASIANAVTAEFGQQLANVGPKSATGTPLVDGAEHPGRAAADHADVAEHQGQHAAGSAGRVGARLRGGLPRRADRRQAPDHRSGRRARARRRARLASPRCRPLPARSWSSCRTRATSWPASSAS